MLTNTTLNRIEINVYRMNVKVTIAKKCEVN